jgi:hypothetical protein
MGLAMRSVDFGESKVKTIGLLRLIHGW